MGLLRQPDPWDTGGMYRVEIYGRVRPAVLVEGRSQRAVAREFGISRAMELWLSTPEGTRWESKIYLHRLMDH